MILQILKMIWRKRSQNTFLVLEIALAFLILFLVFSLLGKNLKTYNQPIGYNYKNTGIVQVEFYNIIHRKNEEANASSLIEEVIKKEGYNKPLYEKTREELRKVILGVSGIEAVSFTNRVAPYSGGGWRSSSIDDNDNEGLIDYESAYVLFSDEYFVDVYGLNVIEGRFFNEDNIRAKFKPILVNQAFVDKYYKGEGSIVGKKVKQWGEIKVVVGVVDYFKYIGEFSESHPVMIPYQTNLQQISFAQFKYNEDTNPNWEADLNNTLNQYMKGINFDFFKQKDARWSMNKKYWAPIVGFLALSLFLIINVAMGLFGILQYKIKQRRKEIGLRKAIGATNGSISKQFIIEMLLITFIGLLLGGVFAVQVPLLDLMNNDSTFSVDKVSLYQGMAGAFVFVLLVVLFCSVIPSLQASKIQPATSLHEE